MKSAFPQVIQDFSQLTQAQQRVVIANDVIKQIKANVYFATNNNYINNSGFEGCNLKSSVQTLLIEGKTKRCEVCALGCTFLSIIRYENNLTIKEYLDSHLGEFSSGRERMLKYFTKEQLGLIETAFERSTSFIIGNSDFDEAMAAKDFWTNFWDYSYQINPNELLTNIMLNIIANNGTFKPPIYPSI